MGHFDKFKPGKTAHSCDYFFSFSHCETDILVRYFTFPSQTTIAVMFEWEKPSFIYF